MFQLRTAITTFLESFKELFVASDVCSPTDVLAILHFDENLGPEEERLRTYFHDAMRELTETGTQLNYEGCIQTVLETMVIVSDYYMQCE